MNRAEAQPWTDAMRGWVLCIAVVTIAVAYSFRFTSFLHAKELALLLALTLTAACTLMRKRHSWAGVRAFLPLWLWVASACALHVAARPCAVPSDAIVETARWVLLLTTAALAHDLLAHPIWRRRFLNAVIISAVAVALLGLLQYADVARPLFPVFPGYNQRIYSVFGNQDLLGGYLAMVVPILIYRFLSGARAHLVAMACLLPTGAVLVLSECRAAWLAALVGIGVALAGEYSRQARPGTSTLPRPEQVHPAPNTSAATEQKPGPGAHIKRTALLLAVLILLVVSMVAARPHETARRLLGAIHLEDTGVRARMWFWDGTLRMLRDHPVIGIGPGNFAYWSPSYLGEALHSNTGTPHFHNEVHTRYAHNEPLQLAAETGALGLMLWGWMLLRIPWRKSAETAALAGLAVFSLFSFPLHSPPHALAGLLLTTSLFARTPTYKAPPSRSAAAALALAALTTAAFILWAVIIPSATLRRAQDAYLAGRPSLRTYRQAVAHPWPNAQAQQDYAIALLAEGKNAQAEEHFRRALAGLDTGPIYLALGALAALHDDTDQARSLLEASLYRTPSSASAWTRLIRLAGPGRREELLHRARRWLRPEIYKRIENETRP